MIERRALGVFLAGFSAFIELYATQGMLPYLSREFGVTPLQAGATVSATTTTVALVAPLAGLLADRIGRKRTMVMAAMLLAVPTLLAATASDLLTLLVWRAAQGLFIPAIFAATVGYVANECGERVGRTMAAYVTGNILGGVLGRFVSAWVAAHAGFRVAFAALAVLTLVSAVGLALALPAPREAPQRSAPWPTPRELMSKLKDPRLVAGYAVGFNILFVIVGTFTYVGFHLAAPPFRLGTLAIGSIFFVYLTGAVSTPLAGRYLDRIGPRRTLFAGLALASLGLLLTLPSALGSVVVGLALTAAGIFVCQSAANSYIATCSEGARSFAAGLYLSFYYLGGTLGALLPGLLYRSGGWSACVSLLLAVQLVSFLVARFSWQPPRKASLPPRAIPA